MYEPMTFEEYAEKHSVFSEKERVEHIKTQRHLVLNRKDYGGLLSFWRFKKEIFLSRLREK